MTKTSVNIELCSLKAIFSHAKQLKYITSNPVEGVRFPADQKKEPRFLFQDDVVNSIQSIREEWLRNVIFFAAYTGLRISEIVNLKWKNINFDTSVIKI